MLVFGGIKMAPWLKKDQQQINKSFQKSLD